GILPAEGGGGWRDHSQASTMTMLAWMPDPWGSAEPWAARGGGVARPPSSLMGVENDAWGEGGKSIHVNVDDTGMNARPLGVPPSHGQWQLKVEEGWRD